MSVPPISARPGANRPVQMMPIEGPFLPMTDTVRDPQTFVRSFSRGLEVIIALGTKDGSMSLSEVAEAAKLSPSVTRRLLSTLCELGYVKQENRAFSLSPKVIDLGSAYLESHSWSKLLQPKLTMATERLQMTTAAGVLDGSEVVHIVRSPAPDLMHFNFNIGQRFPAFVTAQGRVLLASLDEESLKDFFARYERPAFTEKTKTSEAELRKELELARKQGYSIVDQELQIGLVSIAVPVKSRSGRTAAALNVTTYELGSGIRRARDKVLNVLNAVASDISQFIP